MKLLLFPFADGIMWILVKLKKWPGVDFWDVGLLMEVVENGLMTELRGIFSLSQVSSVVIILKTFQWNVAPSFL